MSKDLPPACKLYHYVLFLIIGFLDDNKDTNDANIFSDQFYAVPMYGRSVTFWIKLWELKIEGKLEKYLATLSKINLKSRSTSKQWKFFTDQQ